MISIFALTSTTCAESSGDHAPFLKVISKDGTVIAYEKTGSGPPLIFITGAICHRKFQPIIDDAATLSQNFTVYNYDRRGRGDSGDTKTYLIQSEVEDIEALIDSAGGKAYIYGHSSGAVLAMETSLTLPNKVKKAYVYDPPYVSNEKEFKNYQLTKENIKNLLAEKKFSQAIDEFLVSIGMPRIFTFLLPLTPGWKRTVQLAPTLLYDITLTENLPPIERLSKIKVPISIAYGEESPEEIKRVAHLLGQNIQGSALEEIPKQDHSVDTKILLPKMIHFFNE
ncbi:alpha/beta hydrolase [Leptospira congkakensis]|uniref:Alpha/beta hydrolase n=2 Tax=Leptospira congkakensis TaxID=2484932 RepID=A0A4Z1AJ73_9LEPT|nr:alpha/beta hydrolase [Leptospira congkakensis]TGL89412.1 alpha/beta hydrolase [Leptospira congkakensis]TGL97378.1 alpha/beta hydrolase [Leptospira congkakensis]